MELSSMLLRFILVLILSVFVQVILAQNLVSNPSFEDTVSCPTGIGQINSTIGWDAFMGSPDYYNYCASFSSGYSVPSNVSGYQYAASGNAHVGIICFVNNIFAREIIANSLTIPLTVGQKYFTSFKVNKIDETLIAGYSVNKLGVKLSTVTQTNATIDYIDNMPMVYTNGIVSDTLNWTTISGSFIADSAYQYIMIGNFFDDANTNVVNDGAGPWAYYLIDDVCLSSDSLLCANFSVSVKENSIENQFSIYPNPATDFVTIQSSLNTLFDVVIYNSIGQLLYAEQNVSSGNLQLDIGPYKEGLFFIKITSQNNQLTYKLLKR